MTVDARLLAEARAAESRLIDADHAADLARADFHRCVRRLQLEGASLRELASALGLSHQRVHQIVEAAGGGRPWRKGGRGVAPDRRCSFCGRLPSEVRKLIAGPGISICESCVETATEVLATGRTADTPTATIAPTSEEVTRERCSFCGKRRQEVPALAAARGSAAPAASPKVPGDVQICAECLALCREILAEELS